MFKKSVPNVKNDQLSKMGKGGGSKDINARVVGLYSKIIAGNRM